MTQTLQNAELDVQEGTPRGRSHIANIRVLMYHQVVPRGTQLYGRKRAIEADHFRRHLEWLDRWGYTTITFADYRLISSGELSPPRRPIILTFDDGYLDTFDVAFPMLQEFGMRGVVFVVAGAGSAGSVWDGHEGVPKASLMSESQILQLHEAGFEIGSHSLTHPRLPLIPRDHAWEEMLQSRIRLEIMLNSPVHAFAYPFGLHNETLKALAREAGYRFACSAWSGPLRFHADPFEIRRTEMSNATDRFTFWLKVKGPYPHLRAAAGRSTSTRVSSLVKKHVSQLRTQLLVSAGLDWPEFQEMRRGEANDESPRFSLLPLTLNADTIDERFLLRAPRPRRFLYRLLPVAAAQLLEAFFARRHYDVVVTWAEHLGLPLAVLMKLTRVHAPHVAIFSWISKPKKAIFLRLGRSHLSRIVLMSSVQRDIAVKRLGVPASAVVLLRWPVDQKFWRPIEGSEDMICAVGREMRDYETLIDALRNLPIRCHIAAGGQGNHRKKDPWLNVLSAEDSLPSNITVGSMGFAELRGMYARSRFVVMPLMPTETDNGTTSILEAMAMGKAVICSRVHGQRDIIRDGETGLFVPPQDPKALREAIEYLWDNPDISRRMGQAARAHVEIHHSLDEWVAKVRATVEAVVTEVAGDTTSKRGAIP